MFINLSIAARELKRCNFNYSIYNSYAKKSLERKNISIDYDNLNPLYIDKNGCRICEEDQSYVILENGVQFRACYKYAKTFQAILNNVLKKGFPIAEVIGYRPQMSRGKLDSRGNRTEFSNHSFGSAIDINPKSNGLYGQCLSWNKDNCRLILGGPWRPGHDPHSIKRNSLLIKEMKKAGFLWGGKLAGKQKDFMHFSKEGN
jgi:hypothetical protein